MKTRAQIALTMLAMLSSPAFGQFGPAAREASPATVAVSGTAEITVPPDEINFDVGIEVRDQQLDKAKADNDHRVAAVLKFLEESGIAAQDVQTDFIGIHPEYQDDGATAPDYFVVERNIGVRLRDVSQFEPLLTGLLKHGVNHVHGIRFCTTELRKHRDAARSLAIRAAKEKAEALTKELGVRVGKVQSISEDSYGGSWTWSGGRWQGNASQNSFDDPFGDGDGYEPVRDGGLATGRIKISAGVDVEFLLE